jgi:non-specific serine/threonine protein kinase
VRDALAAAPYPWERERVASWLETARRPLGQQAYASAWTEGRALALDHAVALALTLDEPAQDQPTDPLSAREREVARLVARGCTNRQIAEQLVISERTAENHLQRILNRLGLRSRTQVATWVVEHDLRD